MTVPTTLLSVECVVYTKSLCSVAESEVGVELSYKHSVENVDNEAASAGYMLK